MKFLNNKMWRADSWTWKNVIVHQHASGPNDNSRKGTINLSHEDFEGQQRTTHCFFLVDRTLDLGGAVTDKSSEEFPKGSGARGQWRPGMTTIKTDNPAIKHPWKALTTWRTLMLASGALTKTSCLQLKLPDCYLNKCPAHGEQSFQRQWLRLYLLTLLFTGTSFWELSFLSVKVMSLVIHLKKRSPEQIFKGEHGHLEDAGLHLTWAKPTLHADTSQLGGPLHSPLPIPRLPSRT